MQAISEKTPLDALRREAFEALKSSPAPLRTSETWRRADFARWRLAELDEAALQLPVDGETPVAARGGAAGSFCEIVGSGKTAIALDPDLRASGVVLKTLEEALVSHADVVRPALTRCAGQDLAKLEAANAAGWKGGAFLFVPPGLRVDRPFDLSFVHDRAEYGFPRLLVVLGDGAEATVIEDHTGCELEAPKGRVSVAFGQVRLGCAAKLAYFYNQGLGPDVTHFWSQRLELGQDAELDHYSILLGSALHKSDLHVELAGAGARSNLYGLVFGCKTQFFDAHTWQMHRAPRTQSNLLFKSALQDRGRLVYSGMIRVEKEAVDSDAYQQNNNMLLSETARADTTPILEILTDQVRCKHGATMGPVSAEELFYLATRGFEPKEAVKTLVMGFFEPILDSVPLERLRAQLPERIERRLS
ncbi:MAG: Fe-S cluster assembly protein SufD [Elusimicrobia bacterium]|nr:Fe-S cluster assembly protein SufD [Elusimicrobiota bacterium]